MSCVWLLTDVLLLELARPVSLDECGLAHTSVADEDQLELGRIRVSLGCGSSLIVTTNTSQTAMQRRTGTSACAW